VLEEMADAFSGWGALAIQYGVKREQIAEVEKKHRLGLGLN
jgi:hypothetical protein